MNHEDIDRALAKLIREKAVPQTHWLVDPQVGHIPYMGSREHYFIQTSLSAQADLENRELLVNECLMLARLVIGSGLLSEEKAVEVTMYSPFQIEGRKKQIRVCRVGIANSAFDVALVAKGTDVLRGGIDGITCQWPLRPIN